MYGTLNDANTYFASRLHSESWSNASTADKNAGLEEATRIIDSLNYKGVKHVVWLIMYEYSTSGEKYVKKTNQPTRDEIIAASATQDLEFPRGQDAVVPTPIEWACYELALALLEGFDSEDAIENYNVVRRSYSSVSTTYAEQRNQEYLVYGIPTLRVWMWLKPYLLDDSEVRISRVN